MRRGSRLDRFSRAHWYLRRSGKTYSLCKSLLLHLGLFYSSTNSVFWRPTTITWRTISVPHSRSTNVWFTRRFPCPSITQTVAGARCQCRMLVSHPEAETAARASRRICCWALACSCCCSRALAWAFNQTHFDEAMSRSVWKGVLC